MEDIEILEEKQSDDVLDVPEEISQSEELSGEVKNIPSLQLGFSSLGSAMRNLISNVLLTLASPFTYLLRLLSGKK